MKWTRVATITAGYLIFMLFSLKGRVEKPEDPGREVPNRHMTPWKHYSTHEDEPLLENCETLDAAARALFLPYREVC